MSRVCNTSRVKSLRFLAGNSSYEPCCTLLPSQLANPGANSTPSRSRHRQPGRARRLLRSLLRPPGRRELGRKEGNPALPGKALCPAAGLCPCRTSPPAPARALRRTVQHRCPSLRLRGCTPRGLQRWRAGKSRDQLRQVCYGLGFSARPTQWPTGGYFWVGRITRGAQGPLGIPALLQPRPRRSCRCCRGCGNLRPGRRAAAPGCGRRVR